MKSSIGSPQEKHMQDEDAALQQVLEDFRSSVHAWSEAEFGKPRTVRPVHGTSWRMAAGWALGCVLAAGCVSAGLYQHHYRLEAARIVAAAQAASQQKLADQQRDLKDNEDLFAKVESDVSRQVPSAMEPLAQLMDVDQAQ